MSGKLEEEWVAVQKQTFTNWMNHKLEGSGYQVTALETDLGDGVILIKLLEVLSHKKPSGNRSSRVTAKYAHTASQNKFAKVVNCYVQHSRPNKNCTV